MTRGENATRNQQVNEDWPDRGGGCGRLTGENRKGGNMHPGRSETEKCQYVPINQ
jgi:hypothetical protein